MYEGSFTQYECDSARGIVVGYYWRNTESGGPSRAHEVYSTYLKKLSDQEKEIDGLTAGQKKLTGDEFAARKEYEDYPDNISD